MVNCAARSSHEINRAFLILAGTNALAQEPGYSRDRYSETRGQRDERISRNQNSYSGMGLNFTVYGNGPFVCSAVESFSNKPQLGRGFSVEEARRNAEALAASYSPNSYYSHSGVRTLTCEGSNSGYGTISVSPDYRGVRIVVDGPSLVECAATSVFDSRTSFIVDANTATEAKALATTACSDGAHVNPMHCEVRCSNAQYRPAPPVRGPAPRIEIEIGRGRNRGRLDIPGRF